MFDENAGRPSAKEEAELWDVIRRRRNILLLSPAECVGKELTAVNTHIDGTLVLKFDEQMLILKSSKSGLVVNPTLTVDELATFGIITDEVKESMSAGQLKAYELSLKARLERLKRELRELQHDMSGDTDTESSG
jgi:hypothetical protein